jgi:glycerol-3-phosphate acyltransferase PlsY
VSLVPWFLLSYLLGAIPTSWLVVRLVRGEDLRRLGSGNLGATNLSRTLGLGWAIPVGLFDVLKGLVPVVGFARLAGYDTPAHPVPLLLGATAVIGHVFSVFVGFRGGKGVATSAGIVLGVAPWAFLAALGSWLLVALTSGYVSLASITAALVLPPAVFLFHPELRSVVWLFALLALLIVFFHRGNLRRLASGTEHRIGRKRA